jgi:hypothetical protein
MKHLFFLMISIGFFITTFGQELPTNKKTHRQEKQQRIDAIVKQEEEGVLKFKKQFVAGFKLTNDGSGVFLEFAVTWTPHGESGEVAWGLPKNALSWNQTAPTSLAEKCPGRKQIQVCATSPLGQSALGS